jgi:hypothetical protein
VFLAYLGADFELLLCLVLGAAAAVMSNPPVLRTSEEFVVMIW